MKNMNLLNVGGNSKSIPIPAMYQDFEHRLLDIDPKVNPDVLCDARNLLALQSNDYDVVYCSHNLEHYYKHDVRKVLDGFKHILKQGGAAHIIVPNIQKVIEVVAKENMDIDDVLYHSALGPILVSDVLYGYSKQIEDSGVEFFAHKTGFSANTLNSALLASGFSNIRIGFDGYNLIAIGFNEHPNPLLIELFKF